MHNTDQEEGPVSRTKARKLGKEQHEGTLGRQSFVARHLFLNMTWKQSYVSSDNTCIVNLNNAKTSYFYRNDLGFLMVLCRTINGIRHSGALITAQQSGRNQSVNDKKPSMMLRPMNDGEEDAMQCMAFLCIQYSLV